MVASFALFGRRAARSAGHCAVLARYASPPLRVAAGQTSTRQIDSLAPGEYKVTLEGAPFEATLRAEE